MRLLPLLLSAAITLSACSPEPEPASQQATAASPEQDSTTPAAIAPQNDRTSSPQPRQPPARPRLTEPTADQQHAPAAPLAGTGLDDPAGLYQLGRVEEDAGHAAAAARLYRQAVERAPGWPEPADRLAWLLSTSDDTSLRDGEQALALAEPIVARTGPRSPRYLETLAAACAECGQFQRAADLVEEARAIYREARDGELEEAARLRLECYLAGQPWRGAYVHRQPFGSEETQQVIDTYVEVIRAQPERQHWLKRVERLAWLLATHPDPQMRDGHAAVRLAEAICEATDFRRPEHIDALAAAYAETGRFTRAVETAQRALALPHLPQSRTEAIRRRQNMYHSGVAYLDADAPAAFDLPKNVSGEAARLAWLHLVLSREKIAVGEHETARRLLEQAAALTPKYRPARLLLGELLLDLGQPGRAAEHLLVALRLWPDDAEVLNELGIARERQGRFIEAAGYYEEALRVQPGWVVAANNLAWLTATRDWPDPAHPERALQLARLICEQTGFAEPTYLDTLAAAQANAGRFDEASWTIRRALDAFRESQAEASPLERRMAWRGELYARGRPYRGGRRMHLDLGNLYRAAGETDRAEEHFAHLMDHWPNDPQALNELGLVWERAGRPRQAARAYRRAVELRPMWAIPANNLAWLLATHEEETVRDASEAVRLAEHVCDMSSHSRPNYLDTLAAAYADAGRFVEAVEAASKALSLVSQAEDPKYADRLRLRLELYRLGRAYRNDAQLHRELGIAARDRDEPRRAARHFRSALALRPRDADLLNELGVLTEREGRTAEAAALYRRALDARPDWKVAANNLAWLLATSADANVRNASQAVERALALCDPLGEAPEQYLDTLAAAYAAAGRFDDAVAVVNAALERADHDPALAKRLRERRELYRARTPYHSAAQRPGAG